MTGPLRRVAMRRPGALLTADHDRWHYSKPLNPDALTAQYNHFASLVERSGAEIVWLPDDPGDRLVRRTVADASEDAGEHVRLAVLDVGIGEPSLGDQSDVLGYVGVGRTGPLAIDYFVKVIGIGSVSRFHSLTARAAPARHPIPVWR